MHDGFILLSSPFGSQNKETKRYGQITRMGRGVAEERKNKIMTKINKSLGKLVFPTQVEQLVKDLDF